jgi:uncharacterized protein
MEGNITPVTIVFPASSIEAELSDTDCARLIAAKLPLSAKASTWGEEVYFRIPVECRLDETATEMVSVGDIGYWPQGSAFCIFFGRTPASTGNAPKPASAVNLAGKVTGPADPLRAVREGDDVRIEKR